MTEPYRDCDPPNVMQVDDQGRPVMVLSEQAKDEIRQIIREELANRPLPLSWFDDLDINGSTGCRP